MTPDLQQPLQQPGWRLAAHVGQAAPPAHWRETLVQMLGHRPRRLGEWTELALYGALGCLQAAGDVRLAPAARLRVLSRGGPAQAQHEALAQWQEGLPMPFTFMQSQPAVTLAALAQALGWQGDAAFMALQGDEVAPLAALGLAGAADDGLLLGRVEAGPEGLRSQWWRWVR